MVFNSKDRIHYFNNLVERVFPNASDNLLEQTRMRDSLRNLGEFISSAMPQSGDWSSRDTEESEANE